MAAPSMAVGGSSPPMMGLWPTSDPHTSARSAKLASRPTIHEDDWEGITEARLLETARWNEEAGTPYSIKVARRIREKIPFLKKHGLLADAGE
jgi:hypothetical protein